MTCWRAAGGPNDAVAVTTRLVPACTPPPTPTVNACDAIAPTPSATGDDRPVTVTPAGAASDQVGGRRHVAQGAQAERHGGRATGRDRDLVRTQRERHRPDRRDREAVRVGVLDAAPGRPSGSPSRASPARPGRRSAWRTRSPRPSRPAPTGSGESAAAEREAGGGVGNVSAKLAATDRCSAPWRGTRWAPACRPTSMVKNGSGAKVTSTPGCAPGVTDGSPAVEVAHQEGERRRVASAS